MSTKKDLAFHLGETWGMDVTCSDADGNPIDLTGATVKWRLASKTAKIMERAIGDGIVIDADPTTGRCKVDVTDTMQTTAAVAVGVYRHELWVVQANGAISVQVVGAFNVAPSLRKQFP
jgi:hypothetical protein